MKPDIRPISHFSGDHYRDFEMIGRPVE